jgi:uncharacterized protein YgbK (DUF1537 family)
MQLPGLTIGIIADDLTGANDTALQFFQACCPTRIQLGWHPVTADTHTQVWAMNTESRHMDPREAVAAVRRSVALLRDQYGVENFYKKMDSTLRGHVADEALAVLDELKADCVVISPAYPAESRRTVGGYQLVHGIPVEQTEVARDPLAPVRQSHIPTLLGQATRPEIVGHIELSTVMRGAGPLLKALSEQIKAGKKLVVIDACTEVDLEQIALVIEKIQNQARVIPCGSAGLAHALTRLWANRAEGMGKDSHFPEKAHLPISPILIVSGSNSGLTRHQIQQLKENYAYYGEGSQLDIVHLSPEKILGILPVDDEITRIKAALDSKNTVVLSLSPSESQYAQTLELAEAHQIDTALVAERGLDVLSKMVGAVLAAQPVKLVLTGGETATRICHDLGSRTLQILGMVETSIPLLVDGHGHWLVTKSGNFGGPLTLANIVKYMKQHESSSSHV